MSEAAEASIDWDGDPLEAPIIQHIAEFLLCRKTFTAQHHAAIMAMNLEAGDLHALKEAIFYLEHANWNVGEAKLQKELDKLDKAGPALDENGNEVNNLQLNFKINRGLAKLGKEYDDRLCQIQIVVDGKHRTFKYPRRNKMDYTKQEDIDNLNRWRHKIFRNQIGRHNFIKSNRTEYHALEEDDLLNRYARQEVDHQGRVGYDKITADYRAVFNDTNLPARYVSSIERTSNSITGFLTRKAVNPPGRYPRHFNSLRRHADAQDKIRNSWQARLDANEHNIAETA